MWQEKVVCRLPRACHQVDLRLRSKALPVSSSMTTSALDRAPRNCVSLITLPVHRCCPQLWNLRALELFTPHELHIIYRALRAFTPLFTRSFNRCPSLFPGTGRGRWIRHVSVPPGAFRSGHSSPDPSSVFSGPFWQSSRAAVLSEMETSMTATRKQTSTHQARVDLIAHHPLCVDRIATGRPWILPLLISTSII